MPRAENKKRKILLFDNDKELADNIKLYLEDIYIVYIVTSIDNLAPELFKQSYDFLIFEATSTDINYNIIINKIRLIIPDIKIVLMCTFFDADNDNERLILGNVDDYIFKPFDVNLLRQKLIKLYSPKRVVSLSG
jgi:DNA-binding response OmpR family regulator